MDVCECVRKCVRRIIVTILYTKHECGTLSGASIKQVENKLFDNRAYTILYSSAVRTAFSANQYLKFMCFHNKITNINFPGSRKISLYLMTQITRYLFVF